MADQVGHDDDNVIPGFSFTSFLAFRLRHSRLFVYVIPGLTGNLKNRAARKGRPEFMEAPPVKGAA